MPHTSDSIDSLYDALMFAKSAGVAQQAGRELVRAVLGENALRRPLPEALRECCRRLRPAPDPADEPRFEDEFVELALWTGKSAKIAA